MSSDTKHPSSTADDFGGGVQQPPSAASLIPDRILFGSCNSQHYQNRIWDVVLTRNATAFVWGGDAIYADDFQPAPPPPTRPPPPPPSSPAAPAKGASAKSATASLLDRLQNFSFAKIPCWFVSLFDAGATSSKRIPKPGTPETIAELYHNLTTHDVGYRRILEETNITIFGTWDDHDYGCNNGDRTYQYKRESAIEYMKFLKTHREHQTDLSIMEERAKAGKGVYGVKVFDFERQRHIQQRQQHDEDNNDKEGSGGMVLLSDEEAGIEPSTLPRQQPLSDRTVAVFVLDVRTNKKPWPSKHVETWEDLKRLYSPDYDGDFLGEEQWTWFETALRRSTAQINIIVSGLQIHPDRFYDGNAVEDWSRFPMAQHRLYQTILQASNKVSAPILVSGDVHMAELLRKDCRQHGSNEQPPNTRMLLEVTTSGMSHSWGTQVCARPNSKACKSKHVSRSFGIGMHFAHNNPLWGWTDYIDMSLQPAPKPDIASSVRQQPEIEPEAVKRNSQYVLQRNFGEFEFDWDNRQVIIRVLGETAGAPPLISTRWDFDVLSGKVPVAETGHVRTYDYEHVYSTLASNGGTARVHSDDWICINYRGHPGLIRKFFSTASPPACVVLSMTLPYTLPAILASLIIYFYIRGKRNSQVTAKKQKQL